MDTNTSDGGLIIPTILWPTPGPINYGVGLSSTQLDALAENPNTSAPVEGSYTYSPAAGTVLGPGNQTLGVTFTPTDTTIYTTASGSVTLVVTNTPQIFWDTPASIPYGTPLGPNQLNAQAYPPGTFTYSPAAGTVLPVGNTTITATFTPSDPNTYTSNTATVVETVNNMVEINWPVPAPIVAGTGVSAAVENATAYNSIPGTFSYSFTPGQVFPVGNNTLEVTFTPADTATYATSTGTTPLAVYKAPPSQPTMTTIAASAQNIATGQVVTLTSTTRVGDSSPLGGTVTFYDSQGSGASVQIGTAQLVGINVANGLQSGQAAISLRLGPGNHNITAVFNGEGFESSTSSPSPITVTGTEPSTLAVTATADATTPANYDFNATITGFGLGLPGGTVTFLDLTTNQNLGTTQIIEEVSQFNFAVTSTPTPTRAVTTATADLNSDGAQDIVVVTYDSSFVTLGVSVSLGNGDGTFQAPVPYTIATDPVNTYSSNGGVSGYFNGVAVGDLNGDGYPDIVLTDSNGGKLDVLLGNGDGTFKNPVAYGTGGESDTAPFPNGTFPQGVSLGDMNGDGILDAVVGNNGPGTVAVMLGNGDGSFQASTEYANGGGNQLAIADFAHTGNLGVVTSVGYGYVSVFLGNGDGSLQVPSQVPIGTQTIGVVAGDFNDDGNADLAVLDQVGNTVSIALGNGDGTFQAATAYATSTDPVSLVAADFNQDGNLDLAVANYVGTGTHTVGGTISNLSLLLGNGDGTLKPETIFPIGSTALAAADLNGDGVIDLSDAGQTALTVVLGGTALSAQLPDVAVNGTGTHTIQATYTPSGDSIYTASTQLVQVMANGIGSNSGQTTPTIIWPQPADVPYGTPLGPAQLDAEALVPDSEGQASVPGTFVYTPAAGTVLPIGTNTLSVTFTPADTTDYSTVTQTTTLNVTNQVLITWPNPAPVVVGTTLGPAQLDATAYVPGTFAYTPPAGTLLTQVGNQTLSVTFTPTSSTYAVTTRTTTLSVTRAAAANGTSTSISVSPAAAATGQPITLTAGTVLTDGGAAVTGGTITFYDGKVLIGSAQIVGTSAAQGFTAGLATLKAPLGPGTHAITAVFGGTATAQGSTSPPAPVTVTGTESSAIALTAAADSTTPANFDFTATISGFGHQAPGGSVSFTDLTSNVPLGTVPLVSATAQFNFSVQTSAVPTEGIAVRTADLNADGLEDLVVLNYGADYTTLNATVYLGKGDGTFQPSTNYLIGTATPDFDYGSGVGGYFNGVAIADLNSDGIPDMVVTDSNFNNVAVLVGNGDGTFAAPVAYATTSPNSDASPFPQNLAVGDMNGDGIPDLVIGNSDDNAVAVLLGNGDATFQTAQEYPAGDGQQIGFLNLVLGDPSASGIPGVFTGGLLFRGNGDGSLQPPVPTITENDPSAIALGDFNGDGKLDIAISSQNDSTIEVALGNGDGTFGAPATYSTDADPTSLVVADVNADGIPDLIVANYVGTGDGLTTNSDLGLLIGTGDGTFQPQTTFPIGSTTLATADFNGDGVIDLADAGQAAVTIVLGGTALTAQLNDIAISGTGTHTIQAAYTPAAGAIYTASTKTVQVMGNGSLTPLAITWPTPSPITSGTALSATQLNATANIPGTFSYSPAAGTVLPSGNQTLTATFTPTDTTDYQVTTATVVLAVLTPAPTSSSAITLTLSGPATLPTATVGQVVTLTAQLAVGDELESGTVTFYDGTTALGTVAVIGGNPANGFTVGTAVFRSRFGVGTHSLTAQFSGTGVYLPSVSAPQPLTVTGTEGSTVALTATPNAVTPANYDLTAVVSGFGFSLPAGVVNFSDLTAGGPLGSQTLSSTNGAYDFIPAPAPGITDSVSSAITDVNGDGIPDLIAEYFSADFATLNVAVSLGVGDGTFAQPTTYPLGAGGGGFGVNKLVVADLNQDGLPDIVATDVAAGGVVVLLNSGSGNFATAVAYNFEGDPQSVDVGDVNGDGIPDVVAADYGSIAVLLGNGDGTLAAPAIYPSQGNDGGIVLGSFSGGGRLDALVLSQASNSALSLVPGNGDGSFQPARQIGVGNAPNSIVAGDFNRDGKLDAAVTNSADGTVSVLLGNGDGTFAPQVTYTVGAAPLSIVTADVNGDGKLDLVVANGTSQTISVLLGQGDGTFLAQTTTPPVPGVGYLAVGDLNGDGVPDISISEIVPYVLLGGTAATATLPNTALPGTGTQRLQAAFVPGTGSIYTASTGTVTVTGNGSLTPETLTWATPAPIPFGTPLSSTQLDAVASVPGTITYSPAAGTMLGVGSYTLTATFTPTDTVDYTVLTQTVTLVVTQATPVITWPTPAPVSMGTALSGDQLDATASVPGTFVYTPPAGTVLPGGSQTLTAVFTPTDTVDYTTATATVTLEVTGGLAAAVLSGPPTAGPGSQPSVTLTLAAPYPTDLVATFTLSVQPAVAGGIVDPRVQFASGGATYAYTIPQGQTTVPPIAFSAGTVAATITVSVTFTSGGVNVTPTGLLPLVVQVPAAPPVLASATLVRNGNVLTVVVQGSSSSRDMTQAVFTFTPAKGQAVSDSTVTVQVAPDFTTWYQNAASDAFGSGFLYTQDFLLSNDATSIGSVSVTLANSIGVSNAEDAQ